MIKKTFVSYETYVLLYLPPADLCPFVSPPAEPSGEFDAPLVRRGIGGKAGTALGKRAEVEQSVVIAVAARLLDIDAEIVIHA